MKIALVTGVTGFLGSHLAGALHRQGIAVTGVTRIKNHATTAWNMCVGDIKDTAFVHDLVRRVRPNIVFHLAANKARTGRFEDFRQGLEDNLLATFNLIDACVHQTYFDRFISIGTCEEYGRSPPPFYEGLRESPVSAYSLSKAAVTHLLQTLHRTHQFPSVVLRPALAYGPGQSTDMFVPALIQALLSGKRFEMSEGRQTRDYVYCADVIEALLLAAQRPGAIGKVINVGSGIPVSVKDIALLTASMIGAAAGNLLDIGKIDYRPNEIMEYVADCQLAEDILGWRPRTSLHDGLVATVEYFRHLHKMDSSS